MIMLLTALSDLLCLHFQDRSSSQNSRCWRLHNLILICEVKKVKKVKCSRYMPGVAQRVGRGIALLFYDRGARRG